MGKATDFRVPARTAPIGGRSNGAYKCQQVNSAHSKIRLVHEARAAAGDHAHREEGQAVKVHQEVHRSVDGHEVVLRGMRRWPRGREGPAGLTAPPRAAVPGEDGRDQKPGHQGDVHGVRLGAQEGQAVGDEEGELGEVQDQGQGRCCRLCPCRRLCPARAARALFYLQCMKTGTLLY